MTTTTAPASQLLDLPLSALAPHPNNPRRTVSVSAGDPLVASIKAQGVLEPLIASPAPEGVKVPGKAQWLVLAGHRRLAAAKLAKAKSVPVIVRHDLTDLVVQVETMLVENIHREDLTPVEEGDAYQLLLDLDGLTQATLADQVGQPRARIRERLKLAAAPDEVRDRLHNRQITIEHALFLIQLQDYPDLAGSVTKALVTRDEQFYTEQARRKLEDRKNAAKGLAACERDGGMTLVEDKPAWDYIAGGGLSYQPHGYHYAGEVDPVADHSPNGACPHRAYTPVTATYDGHAVVEHLVFSCTQPLSHRAKNEDLTPTGGDTTADAHHGSTNAEPTAAQPELSDEEKEQREQARIRHEQLLDAQTVRLTHIRSCLLNPPKGAAQTLMLALAGDPESLYMDESGEQLITGAMTPLAPYWREERRAGTLLLGLTDTEEALTPEVREALQIEGWAAFKSFPLEGQLIYLWWIATLAAEAEAEMTNRAGRRLTADEAWYVAALTDVLGYQWSTVEQELLGITENGRVVQVEADDD